MIEEAIILAGGLGTRLGDLTKNIPKPMLEVCGKPFLSYILDLLDMHGIRHVILSVGYKFEVIKDYYGIRYKDIHLTYAVEDELLGTGGAIKNASKYTYNRDVFILNGDTLFLIDLKKFYRLHLEKQSKLSIALKVLEQANRYGVVEIDESYRIVNFSEKTNKSQVYINGGIYIVDLDFLNSLAKYKKFSFERDFLEKYYKNYKFFGFPFNDYFIDIGIPEDYERIKNEIRYISVDKSWTLFLDRDGVINKKIDGDYVRNWSQFVLIDGVIDALKILRKIFGRIIIITNQRGIGRGLMTEEDLLVIHQKMLNLFRQHDIYIDGIYYCPHDPEKELCNCRKPKPGLVQKAKQDFTEIDLRKSAVVGDSEHDIILGKSLEMFTVYISQDSKKFGDLQFAKLLEFAMFLKEVKLYERIKAITPIVKKKLI